MRTLEDDIRLKNIEQKNYSDIDINQLLQGDKKVVAFMGTSKSGTTFLINHIAEWLSYQGVNVAILDTTQNKSTYYLYTKNEENLRKKAITSIEDLTNGIANGIKVKENLTVYTGLPKDNTHIQEVEPILETLIKNHSLVLIDADFNTPTNYFEYAMEIYLVQTMDILTIQPLTEILSELKNRRILKDSKLRIIINKYIELVGVTEKEIIGGMAFYNDPTMSYMKELFNKNLVKYSTILFEKEIYEKYLESLVKCDINLNGYSRNFMDSLQQISDEIYPFIVGRNTEN